MVQTEKVKYSLRMLIKQDLTDREKGDELLVKVIWGMSRQHTRQKKESV